MHKYSNSQNDGSKEKTMLEQYNQEYEAKENEWKQQLKDYDDETERKQQALDQQHEQELQKFNNSWANSQFLEYRKPSGKLLNLWRMEKFLAKQKKFDNAERIHNEAEELAKKETEQANKAISKDYNTNLNALRDKQKIEMDNLNETRENGRKYLIILQSKEKDCYTNKKRVIDFKCNDQHKNKEAQKTTSRGAVTTKYASPDIVYSFAYQGIEDIICSRFIFFFIFFFELFHRFL